MYSYAVYEILKINGLVHLNMQEFYLYCSIFYSI